MGRAARAARARRRQGRVKDLASGEQVEVKREEVAAWLRDEKGHETLMMRTHRAGDLRAEHVGAEVVVCGWVAHRRDHGGVVFLDVRDAAGPRAGRRRSRAGRLRGRAPRAQRMGAARRRHGAAAARRAPSTSTCRPATIEVGATAVEVLNEAEPPPFPLDEPRRHRRGAASAAPLPRPAARADAAQPAPARRR